MEFTLNDVVNYFNTTGINLADKVDVKTGYLNIVMREGAIGGGPRSYTLRALIDRYDDEYSITIVWDQGLQFAPSAVKPQEINSLAEVLDYMQIPKPEDFPQEVEPKFVNHFRKADERAKESKSRIDQKVIENSQYLERLMEEAERDGKTMINLTNHQLAPGMKEALQRDGYKVDFFQGRYNDTELIISWGHHIK